ncbi:MAG: GAF domain-containing protein [Candidatus Zixiibacteriota bacterium]
MKKGEGVASSYQQQLEALNQLSRAILSNVDLEKIEKLLVEEIQSIFRGVGCILYVPDGNGYLVPKTPARIRGEDLSKIKIKIGQGVSGRAWTRQVPIYSNDILRRKDFSRGIHRKTLKLNISKLLSVPLPLDGEPIGLLSVARSPQQPDFTNLDGELLAGFSNQAAIAIKNASTHQTLKREQEALQESAERYRRVFEDSPMGLYRTTPDGRILMANPALLKMLGYSSFDELSKRNLEQSGFGPEYPRSMFVNLIETKGEVVGLESAWIRADGSTLYVRENARAIRDGDGNTLYYEGSVEDITESRLLNEISRIVNSSLDLDEVLKSIMRESCEALDFQGAAIFLYNHRGKTFELSSTYNVKEELIEKIHKTASERLRADPLHIDRSIAGRSFKSGKVISYDKLTPKDRKAIHRNVYDLGIKAFTYIPIAAKGRKIGLLVLASEEDKRLDLFMERMASAIGNQVGMAIENASIHEALKGEQKALQKETQKLVEKEEELLKSNLELKLLNDLSRIAHGSLDLEKVLKTVMRQACKALGFQAAGILLYSPSEEALDLHATYMAGKADVRKVKATSIDARRGLSGEAFKSGKVISYYKLSPEKRKKVRKLFYTQKLKALTCIPVTARGETIGVLNLVSREEVRLDPFLERMAAAIGNQVGIAIENARLYENASQQAEKLAGWNKRLSTFLSVSQAAVESADLDSFLTRVTRLVAENFKADRCSVVLVDKTGTLGTVRGLYPKGKRHFPQSGEKIKLADYPHLSMMCLEGKIGTFNLPDFRDASNFEYKHILRTRMKSAMGVPLRFEKGNLGALTVWHIKPDRKYSQEEIDFLAAIANQAATAIKKFELAQEVEEKRENLERLSSEIIQLQEKERKAVAGELHDSVGQSLTAMRMNLDFAENSLPPGRKELRNRIRQTSKLVADTMEEIRSMGQKLRPTMLDDLGLIPTLRWFIKDFSQQLSIPVHFRSQGNTKRLTPDLKITVYRIVQEGLNNIAKHSKATEAWISLQVKNSVCSLEVKDDGIGIDAEKVLKSTDTRRGFGVFNIRERASLLGGKLEIQSDKGKGTTLLVTIPVPEGEPDEQSQSSISR